jgi:general secretion pathway protein N
VRPHGVLRLSGDGLAVESARGRWRVEGSATLEVLGLSSALAPLDRVGSYRLELRGGGEGAQLTLHTLQGPLQLSGDGQWIGPRLRFRGEGRAEAGSETALANLLYLLGQRRGGVTLLSIG